MPTNVLQPGNELFAIIAGILVFLGAALAFSFKYRATSSQPAEKGTRPPEGEEDEERVSPDGFIDSFAGTISEAGGGMPLTGWIIMGVVSVCYVVYLFVNWNPGG
jgi:hypothetical protein